jgi:serine/alanine adding enzyme
LISQHLLTPDQERDWERFLPRSTSVFGSVAHARLCERFKDVHARLFVCEDSGGAISYPFLVRPVESLPFAGNLSRHYEDSLTPEFTGPIAVGQPQAAKHKFSQCFGELCARLGIVAEFAHLHCWNDNVELLKQEFVESSREIIWVDLQTPYEHLWHEHFAHACRKNINRATKEGVRVLAAVDDDHIREFHRIYSATMDRNAAHASYYFPLDYFLYIRDEMSANARFTFAEYRGAIVAATLYLYDDADVYSYLGGADIEFQHVRPTNAVVQDTIQWAQSMNKKRMVLGGGYRPDDGIFRFKASFSPLRARFSTYRRVHIPRVYDDLVQRWSEYNGAASTSAYFPAYRAVASKV